MVVLADTAGLALDHVGANKLAEHGGLVRLPRVVGPALATELLLTGRRVAADEAARLGLANRVVPAADVLPAARELATAVAGAPSLAVRLSLEVMADAASEPDTFEAARRPRVAYDDIVIGE
jgi:acetyl-CoA C-acetyltransferase